jgi:tetratricopeptide (TPR) repeat protein
MLLVTPKNVQTHSVSRCYRRGSMFERQFSGKGTASVTTFCMLMVAVASVIWPVSTCTAAEAKKGHEQLATSNTKTIVCLHTEYMPLKEDEALKYRLMRELGRQAVLIAARDELGISTRDEILGEAFPESVTKDKQDVFIAVRSQYDGAVRFQIWSASKPQELLPTKKEKPNDPRVILNQTKSLEPRIRGELRDKLRDLGFNGEIQPANEKNLPPDSIEQQLAEMNFVSQFAVVRDAHAAIAAKGQSCAWLGVLARGYANLSLLTEHHWKSDTEVFAARALLYAERLVATNPSDPISHGCRAYVWAIVGLHAAALDEFKQVAELRKQKSDQTLIPDWVNVIEPYCSFKREPLIAMGQKHSSLQQLAQRLAFELERAFGDDRLMFASAKQTMSVCPEDFSVYAALTRTNGTLLTVVRTGANYAPIALAKYLPTRINNVREIPTEVLTASVALESKNDDDLVTAAKSSGDYIVAVTPIVQALRKSTEGGGDKGEPSWSALGELIFEEQFVQAANYLEIALNATESSYEAEVNTLRPALKGHRYVRHIESYAVRSDRDPASFTKIIGDMPIIDPRGNMQPMISRVWRMDNGKGRKSRGSDASWEALFDRGITYNAMLEAYNAAGNYWWPHIGNSMRRRWAEDFRAISPYSPQTLQFAISLTDNPSYKQMRQWETEAGEDPGVFRTLASMYAQLQHSDDAIRAYERSIKISPSEQAFTELADTYRNSGQEDMWQPTLERFFQVETLGLEHADVHKLIAHVLIEKNKWKEAEPHGLAAAQTWSSWGLDLASCVEEGLGHWDESEKWIREESTSYPSNAGAEWYFWCRRTGRGNREEARNLAETYFHEEWLTKDYDGELKLLTFHLLENDLQVAFADAKNALKLADETHTPDYDMVYPQLQLAFVGRELKDSNAAQTATKEIRRLSERFRGAVPEFSKIAVGICNILDDKPITDSIDAALNEQFRQAPKLNRCNYDYFVGRAYELVGKQDLAEKYYKRCVTNGPFSSYAATLAGKYLSDRHKTSRP